MIPMSVFYHLSNILFVAFIILLSISVILSFYEQQLSQEQQKVYEDRVFNGTMPNPYANKVYPFSIAFGVYSVLCFMGYYVLDKYTKMP